MTLRSLAVLCSVFAGTLALAAPAAAAPAFITQWGSLGSADGQFREPYGVAVDQAGNVYVADSLNHRIQKFSASGAFIAKWGTLGTGAGQFNEPRAVAVGPSGSVYVTDLRNNRVQQFTPNGVFVRTWGWGVQTGARVPEICSSGCRQGVAGAGAGGFNGPVGIDTDPAGNVYVASQGGHNIQKFTSTGAFVTMWGRFAVLPTDDTFNEPYDVDADRFGNVYVYDGANSRIMKFTSTGGFLTKWGSLGTGPGQFQLGGGGLATSSNGNVYVADQNNRRIQVFTPAGAFIESFSGPGNPPPFPTDITLDGLDNVYVANRFSHTIQKFGTRSAPAPRPIATPTGRPLPALQPPVLGRTVNVEVLSGQVLVSPPPGAARAAATVPGLKGRTFVPLREARSLPVGSILDTRRGTVRLTSARDTRGAVQRGSFGAGVFQVRQSPRGGGLTELSLKGASFRSCGRARLSGNRALAAARRVSRRRIRRLRGNANGRFRTRGRYSAATVRGTTWTVTDRCDGTLTKVTRGSVVVRDFRRRRNFTVRAGKRTRAPGGGRGSYLARPR